MTETPVDGEGQAALLLRLPRPAAAASCRLQAGPPPCFMEHRGGGGGGVAGRGWRESRYTPPCHLTQSRRAPAA